eukprot:IDg4153t1
MCIHCHKHRNSNRCYRKFPHLAPKNHHNRNRKALVSKSINNATESDSEDVCLLGISNNQHFLPPSSCLAAFDSRKNKHCHSWILDSGCTSHMTFDRSAFITYSTTQPVSVDFGAESNAQITGTGSIQLNLLVSGKSRRVTLENVKHVPELRFQLISISAIAQRGMQTEFDEEGARIIRKIDQKVICSGSLVKGLYSLDVAKDPEKALTASIGRWHERLAHINFSGISSMVKNNVVRGIQLTTSNSKPCCIGCIMGKSDRTAIPKASNRKTKSLLELVHSDVIGPIETESIGGARYVITFIDDKSKWTVEYTMHRKSESLDCFKKYKAYAERHTNQVLRSISFNEFEGSFNGSGVIKLKRLRSDNGGEYLSNEFKSYLETNGIKHELTVAYTPQQNGVAERMNRTLLNLVRSMLHHKSVEKRFWAEALATAVYVRNRVTSRSLPPNMTPYHFWQNTSPDLSHMRVFWIALLVCCSQYKSKETGCTLTRSTANGLLKSKQRLQTMGCRA